MKISPGQRRKSAARLYALQALFQMEVCDQSVDAVCREFEEFRFGDAPNGGEPVAPDVVLFRGLIEHAVNFQARIDQMANRALAEGWPIDRIDPTLRALFRAAGAELIGIGTAPKVVISEFIEVAKAFFPDGKEPKFANAVLDRMAREAQPEAF
ncbi:MAG: transcription antitermination factor NusB [Rhodobacter sp.]|nr:transcription antitermination factor NusB [Rhodobacter sp.]MCY4167591.1 transcription antitermination factor NusB [Rhodobacter sp.]MCY4241085.1 transcription antitermination factor NusB [Rhodobacter sp.]